MDTTRVYQAASQVVLSGTAASVAEIVTIPFDTVKVRLQLLQRAGTHSDASSLSPMTVIRDIYKHEGSTSFYKGVEAGVHRQLIFAGVRIGLYNSVLNLFRDRECEPTIIQQSLAASITSAIGITLANPSDVIKVRTQAIHASGAPGVISAIARESGKYKQDNHERSTNPRYSSSAIYTERSALRAYSHILAKEGFTGGWFAGYYPNLLRNTLMSACELVSYKVSRKWFLSHGVPDNSYLAMMSGIAAGLVATLLGNPIDLVATRIMVNKKEGIHHGVIETCKSMLWKEGPLAFYQGSVANFLRVGSFNVVLWIVYEQLNKLSIER